MTTRTHASPKADFILGLPSTLSVAEVVERAAAAGMSLSGSMVRKTRAAKGQRGAAFAGKKRPAARPRASSEAAPRPGSKRAFVLSFPHETPASDIVSAAKAKGFPLPAGYVYWVRSDAARKARKGQPKGAVRLASSSSSATSPNARAGRRGAGRDHERAPHAPSTARGASEGPLAHREAEGLLVQTALRVVGIERAIELLKSAHARIDRLLQD